ncbi:hypothetical protein B7755_035085 [Streptomyces sp. NBS 14/10]|uniref:nSTAND1 domain-containing NTPase n=1 Tax=Streptomyces sp. NBS 14/10 TaxID=1945643 RepID=UPI000B8025AA|nr:hypothetical protein [Streptomyces sp. NBS 14/10]KAK1182905.1 hypothetical protein B7755_035085 [Streptomyces sp. NBS 14/10]
MGRQERPLDPGAGPEQRFAFALRKLRSEAGGPTYRAMAQRTPYTVSTLSRAAAGEQLPSLEVALAYVAACGGDREEWERHWRQTSEEITLRAVEDDDAEPPYQGLARFEPGDHERFFGRDRLVGDLVGLVRTHRFVVLVGASGSGKSSLLRAGLIPRLRGPDEPREPSEPHERAAEEPYESAGEPYERPAAVRILAPGEHPARTHTEALAPMSGEGGEGETVVVVDQFEEVFTLCRDPDERKAFLDRLLDARRAGSGLRVVVAVRADFFGHCAEHRELAESCREATLLIGPMTPDELRDVIVKPATAAGLVVERSLTARLIAEVDGEPGGLPLLSHVLLEAWRRRKGRTLAETTYDAVGGVRGAVARTAEDVYARLTPAQASLARRVLLRLITPGEGAQDTRRGVDRAELDWGDPADTPADTTPADTTAVLDRLARARLITLDENTVDLAHEALITAWPRLRGWVAEDRERLRTHRQLTEAARAWEELRRETGALYRGTRLAVAREWAARDGALDELNSVERAFLEASIGLEDGERAAAARRARRLAFLAACLAVLLVVVTAVGVVAVRQRHSAVEAQRVAVSRQLAAQALNLGDSRPGTAMLLAVEAYRTAPTPEARGALLSMSARRSYQAELNGHADAVSEVAFSPDGTLASVGRDGKTVLWDARHHTRLATLTGHATWLRAVDFSPDGRRMATGGDDRKVVLWDVAHRTKVATLTGHRGPVKSVAFSPDGRTVAGSSDDGTVILWDVKSGSRRVTLTGHRAMVWAVEFSPDGKLLATASADRTVRLWSAATGEQLAVLRGHTRSVDAVAFSPDGKLLASASQDYTARVWDVRRRTSVARLVGHGAEVRAVGFSPDGRTVATSGQDHTVMLWDAERHTRQATLVGHGTNIYSLAYDPSGTLLATAGESGSITLWDPTRIPLTGLADRVNKVVFSPDGRALATAGQNGSAVLWDVVHRTPRAVLPSGHGTVRSAAFSPDGRTLATVTGISQDTPTGPASRPPSPKDQTLMLWPLAGRAGPRRPVTLTGHTARVLDVAYSPDGRIIATGAADKKVMLWDAARGTRLATFTADTGTEGSGVNAVAFSPDGRTLATANYDGRVTLWNVARRTRMATLTGHTGQVRAVTFSPDGRTLASAGIDQTVMLWDVARHTRLATLAGDTGPAFAVAFSPDGRTLATANADTSVMLWDVARRKQLATFTGHTAQVRSVAFSPDGRTLATAGDDGTVRLWNTDPRRTATQLCSALSRDLTREEWKQLIPEKSYRRTCDMG